MEKQKLIEYLRDVFELEKQRRIEKNAMDYMADEYKKAEGSVREGRIKHKAKVSKLSLGVGIYFSIVSVAGLVHGGSGVECFVGFIIAIICLLNFTIIYTGEKKDEKITNAMKATLVMKAERDKEVLNENFVIIKRAYNETVGALKELYAVDIIYPKYRSLEACGMFLEYLMAGRTSSLEASGTDQGAYNIYEDELFKGIIINKLDQVLSNQRLLIEGQKYISKQMETMIGGLNEVRKLTEDIKTSAQISAFCNTVTAYNTSVTRKIAEQKYY